MSDNLLRFLQTFFLTRSPPFVYVSDRIPYRVKKTACHIRLL